MVRAMALILALAVAWPASAQKDPAQMTEWGAMFNRIDKITGPYQARLGLPRYWGTYCYGKVGAEEDSHVKDGTVPLGVADWRTLSHDDFKRDLSVLEDWRTAATLLCFADVKARLNAAEPHPSAGVR